MTTWYRVKIYQADDSDMERLVVDTYVESDCAANAAFTVAQHSDDGLLAAMREFSLLTSGVCPVCTDLGIEPGHTPYLGAKLGDQHHGQYDPLHPEDVVYQGLGC